MAIPSRSLTIHQEQAGWIHVRAQAVFALSRRLQKTEALLASCQMRAFEPSIAMRAHTIDGSLIASSAQGYHVVTYYDIEREGDLSLLGDAVCTFGVFDGLHMGHRYLIDTALSVARDTQRRCVCITFDIDPDELLKPGFKKLMTNEHRIDALLKTGVDDVLVLRFTQALSTLAPLCFLDAIMGASTPAELFVGEDIHFGHKAKGDLALLSTWAAEHNIKVHGIGLLFEGGSVVTSTRIRGLLEQGKVEESEVLLTHPFSYASTVLPGRHEGQSMGFRTANLEIPDELCALADGVYAAWCLIDGHPFKAAVSVGVSPTFKERTRSNVEAHILDFEGDLYGSVIEIQFKHRLRDMIKFDRVDDLIATIENDFSRTRSLLDEKRLIPL